MLRKTGTTALVLPSEIGTDTGRWPSELQVLVAGPPKKPTCLILPCPRR
jgi:hypothetical protein